MQRKVNMNFLLCETSLASHAPRRTAINEYQLCVEKRGREDASCVQRGRDYASLCPQKWVEDWKEQNGKGIGMTLGKEFFGAQ